MHAFVLDALIHFHKQHIHATKCGIHRQCNIDTGDILPRPELVDRDAKVQRLTAIDNAVNHAAHDDQFHQIDGQHTVRHESVHQADNGWHAVVDIAAGEYSQLIAGVPLQTVVVQQGPIDRHRDDIHYKRHRIKQVVLCHLGRLLFEVFVVDGTHGQPNGIDLELNRPPSKVLCVMRQWLSGVKGLQVHPEKYRNQNIPKSLLRTSISSLLLKIRQIDQVLI